MITTPMCTGLMSPSSVSLLMIGMKMMIAGMASMKSPTMTNSSHQQEHDHARIGAGDAAIQSETTSGPRR